MIESLVLFPTFVRLSGRLASRHVFRKRVSIRSLTRSSAGAMTPLAQDVRWPDDFHARDGNDLRQAAPTSRPKFLPYVVVSACGGCAA